MIGAEDTGEDPGGHRDQGTEAEMKNGNKKSEKVREAETWTQEMATRRVSTQRISGTRTERQAQREAKGADHSQIHTPSA